MKMVNNKYQNIISYVKTEKLSVAVHKINIFSLFKGYNKI